MLLLLKLSFVSDIDDVIKVLSTLQRPVPHLAMSTPKGPNAPGLVYTEACADPGTCPVVSVSRFYNLGYSDCDVFLENDEGSWVYRCKKQF